VEFDSIERHPKSWVSDIDIDTAEIDVAAAAAAACFEHCCSFCYETTGRTGIVMMPVVVHSLAVVVVVVVVVFE
jgi:hypothetical protein